MGYTYKAHIYKKRNQFRFTMYGRSHFVAFVDENDERFTKILESKQPVSIYLETPDYINDSKAIIGDIPCHVMHVEYPTETITITEATPITFHLIERIEEHDLDFDVDNGTVFFDDKGLTYSWRGKDNAYVVKYKGNWIVLRGRKYRLGEVHHDYDVITGLASSIMKVIEDSQVEWSSMQEHIEDGEDFAIDYLREFGEYCLCLYCDGVAF